MRKLQMSLFAVLFLAFMPQMVFTAPSTSLKIFSKTNIGPVEYWFTESAETNARNDGSQIPNAIGPEHFPLIESLANAGRQMSGFKAYVISRVNFLNNSSLELKGVVINGELYELPESSNKEIVKQLIALLSKNSIHLNGNVVSIKK